jgi:propanol-preferring alcohol dehydrogenase
MRAMVLEAYDTPLTLKDLPTPKPGPREALVKVLACGAGLTLHHALRGTNPVKLPAVVGHEIFGEVVELGSAAEGIAVGDKVTLYCIMYCGECRFCRTGRESVCIASPGMIGNVRHGGFAEYMTAPDKNLLKLPPALVERYTPAEIGPICDAMATPFKVARKARLAPLETCVVYGAAGGVGIHMLDVIRLAGARIIAVDRGEAKLKALAKLGAHDVVDAAREDVPEAVMRLTGGQGADVVADYVGSKETLEKGLACLGKGGRLVIVGLTANAMPSYAAGLVMRNEIEILGSRGFNRQEVLDCLELTARGLLRPVVNHVLPLEQANEATRLVAGEGNVGRVVLTM